MITNLHALSVAIHVLSNNYSYRPVLTMDEIRLFTFLPRVPLGRFFTGSTVISQVRSLVFLYGITIGRTLVSEPFGLPGFCINMSTPLPRPSGSWCSSASLNMSAIGCASKSAEHLNSSQGSTLTVDRLPGATEFHVGQVKYA